MAVKNITQAIGLTSIDSATFTGSYQLINTAGTPNPCFLLKIINNSTKDVTVSYDGTHDNDFVPTLTTALLQTQTNAQPNNFINNFAQGTKVYVKSTAGTGSVYLAGYYQPSAS